MLDDLALARVCEQLFATRLRAVLFRSGHLSQVVGAELADGRTAVLKIRPYETRIIGCAAVQEHLVRAGFPGPALLAGPIVTDGLAITAETLIPDGRQLPAARGAGPYARLLAWLIRSAPDVAMVPDLAPSPPWTGWDHPGAWLWPDPGDAATVGQSADFIDSYQRAAGLRWTERDVQHAWAAGLWVRLFNAKKDAASGGGPQLARLAGEIGERLSLAAL